MATYRIPLPPIVGLLDGWVDVDRAAAFVADAATLSRVFLTVNVAPSGTDLEVDIRTATAGGGSALQGVILDGTTSGTATGSVSVDGGTTLQMRISQAGATVQGLSGYIELVDVDTAYAALTSLDRVKRFLGIATGTTTHDALLNELVSSVSSALQQEIGFMIADATMTAEKYDGSGFSDAIVLRGYPVTDTTTPIVTLGDDTLAVGDYVVMPSGVLIYTPDDEPKSWPKGRRNVGVTYSAGFAAVPENLAGAATEEVALAFKRSARGDSRLGLESSSPEVGGSVTYQRGTWLNTTRQTIRQVVSYYGRTL